MHATAPQEYAGNSCQNKRHSGIDSEKFLFWEKLRCQLIPLSEKTKSDAIKVEVL